MAKKNVDLTALDAEPLAVEYEAVMGAPKGKRSAATPQEAAQRAAELRTGGRKGCKAERLNMAFTPENLEYIRIMSGLKGKPMAIFVNSVIEQHRLAHAEAYKAAQDVAEMLRKED